MRKKLPNFLKFLFPHFGTILMAMILLVPDQIYAQTLASTGILVAEKKLNQSQSNIKPLKEILQDFTVSGRVTAQEDGQPLPGVNVIIKGTSVGTVTDLNGDYTLRAPNENSVLVFSFIGFESIERAIGGNSNINISMVPDIKSLDEIVVIGYGTQKRSDLTGAVGSVDVETLRERPAASLNQALAGRLPGVQVTTNSGRPGGRNIVRIRGFSSINSSNNPLYVVDGVMLPMGNQANGSQAIDYINPNDIVSVEV
jgi:hypothetical protein